MTFASTVQSQLRRFGQPCTVSWTGKGIGSAAVPASSLPSVIRIGSRTTTVVAGVLTSAVNAQMPAIGRSLQGATVTAGGRTYAVQSATEMVSGGEVYLTKVVLT